MNVTLLAHTQLSKDFIERIIEAGFNEKSTHGQLVALTAIRTCYSHNEPSKIVELEGEKYFGQPNKEGGEGTDADRLIHHIMKSGHTSTIEHLNFTFAIEGVSRSLLAQLTRHRHFSYSVQSQRYVKFGSEDKAKGFKYVMPPSVFHNKQEAIVEFAEIMDDLQDAYDRLRKLGIPAEDARYILPNAAVCNLVLTGNLRSLLDFYGKRSSNQAQFEIQSLAEELKNEVVKAEPWTESFFK